MELTGIKDERAWLREPDVKDRQYRRPVASTQLTPYADALRQALTADARRPKREQRTAKALLEDVKAQGYEGCYSRVTDFVRAWRAEGGEASARKAFVPLAFEWGEAYQFDWSEEGVVVGGVYYRAQVAHMTLCASRAFWLVAYPGQGHEMLFDAHTRSFAALGGVARRGIYDNMKTAVDKVLRGKERVVNARFAALCAHYLVEQDFCNVTSGWEKGMVVWWRRTYRMRGGASSSRRQANASRPSPTLTPGWRRRYALCGKSCITRSTGRARWPSCWSTNGPT